MDNKTYRPELIDYRAALRIYIDGKPTSAYIVLIAQNKSNYPANLVQAAYKLQNIEDEKPF